jgi:hypothetical protein
MARSCAPFTSNNPTDAYGNFGNRSKTDKHFHLCLFFHAKGLRRKSINFVRTAKVHASACGLRIVRVDFYGILFWRRLCSSAMIETEPELSEDLLRGAAAISEFVYGDPDHRRKIYYLWATSKAPFFKFGSMICARKSVLLRWIRDQEVRRSGENFNRAKNLSVADA